jgi:hypothetical protein
MSSLATMRSRVLPQPSLDPKQLAATARLTAQIRDLLAHEAYTNLLRQAEQASPDEQTETGALARKWFGFTVDQRQQLLQIDAERIVLERARRKAEEDLLVAEIREDAYLKGLAETALVHLDEEEHTLDDRVGALAQDWETQLAAERERLVAAEVERLYGFYLALSERLPFSLYHPAVPESLRRWGRRQLKQTGNPVSRLYLYLAVRELVFHAAQNGGPLADTRPERSLEVAAAPKTRAQARDEAVLASQFVHPNGDRRVARDTPLTRLHEARLRAHKSGDRFTDQLDHEERDYHGLPQLEALVPAEVRYCRVCAHAIRDFIEERTEEPHGEVGYRYVERCVAPPDDPHGACPDGERVLSALYGTQDECAYQVALQQLRAKRRRRQQLAAQGVA